MMYGIPYGYLFVFDPLLSTSVCGGGVLQYMYCNIWVGLTAKITNVGPNLFCYFLPGYTRYTLTLTS